MNPAANQRIAPGRVLLIMVVLLAVWAGFQFWPQKKPAPSPWLPPVQAESKLQAVGLANNPDWAGLPELFAVWVDQIPWVNDRTYFAYWDPGATAYAYFFEATRGKEGIRFRSAEGLGSMFVPEGASGESLRFDDEELARYAAERRAGSPTHPFVFPKRSDLQKPIIVVHKPSQSFFVDRIDQPSLKPIPTPISPPAIDLSKPPNAGNGQ